jgi:hypothetical protein
MSTPTHEFQSHFGTAPGLPDPVAECKKWENLCGELLAERQKLRDDLANAETERDRYLQIALSLRGQRLRLSLYR